MTSLLLPGSYTLQWKKLHFLPCLLVLLVLDSLAHPYAGIVHDGRLYALQALSHIHPGRYDQDLYFLFGSQDSYTIFSPIYVLFIQVFDLINGTLVLYVLSKSFFLGSVLYLFRKFCLNDAVAFVAAAILASNAMHYIFFDVNEPFLTPRLVAQGFALFALASAINGPGLHFLTTIILLFAAALLHPIMAFGAGVAVVMLWVLQKEWRGLTVSVLALVILSLALYSLKPESFFGVNTPLIFDEKWRAIVFERSTYLFPTEWPKDEWLTILSSSLVCIFTFPFLSTTQKKLVAALLLAALACLAASIIFTYLTTLAVPFQLQFWRSVWLLRVINPLLCLLWGYMLWNSDHYFKRLAAPMVVIPACIGGGITSAEIYWPILAVGLSFIPVIAEKYISNPTRKVVFLFVVFLLFLIPLPTVFVNLQTYATLMTWQTATPWVVMVLGPLLPIVALFLTIYLLITFSRMSTVVLTCCFLVFLYWPGSHDVSVNYSPLSALEETTNAHVLKVDSLLDQWQQHVSPGSLILTDSMLPVERIWFDLKSSSYWSRWQGAGIVFNRDLAMEYERRRGLVKLHDMAHSGNVGQLVWQETDIDYIISRGELLPLH